MNKAMLFNFIVDKENNEIKVERFFNAPIDLVWAAWTEPEILDQWWAPKPYKTVTKSMDFSEGGTWLYSMVSPKDERHWCKKDYRKIEHLKSFTDLDAFCDENGKINEDFPRTLWTNTFNESEGATTVSIVLKYEKLADLEKVIELGFKEGFTMGLNQLDELLTTLKTR